MTSVWVKSIQLAGFRNYEKESVALDPGLNLFLGRNAQGKTNLLEAVYIASAGRSYRASSDFELVRHGGTFYRIVAESSAGLPPLSGWRSATPEMAESLSGSTARKESAPPSFRLFLM